MSRTPAPDNVVSLPGIGAMAAAIDQAAEAPALADPGDQAPFGGRDEDDGFDRPRLPKDCPVKALGVTTDGMACCYLNRLGQLVTLTPRDHGKNNINLLFAPDGHLPTRYWPRWSEPKYEGRGESKVLVKPSEIVGFKQDDASEALIDACGRAGIFDKQGRIRGGGAHAGAGKALILNCGDQIMVARPRLDGGARREVEWFAPGVIGDHVYPAGTTTPRPDPDPAGGEAGEQMLALLETWRWARPTLDAMLMLGWIGQAFVGGALPWRSHLLLTGGKGTGKSSLNGKDGVLDRLLGKARLRTGNASEAAVRQKLQAQTIPVIFDEFEPNEFNGQKMKAVVELARVASSGDEMHRGGQDHKVHEFVLASPFLFSAILLPPMEPQDRSRFAILELEPFDGSETELNLDAAKLPALGRRLMRRMVDGWPRLVETYSAYKRALAKVGHSNRAQDQFGTLLACADLLLWDHAPDAKLLEHWAQLCHPEGLAEIADAADEHESCLLHLSTATVQARGGDERETIATWLGKAVSTMTGIDADGARKKLGEIGLAVVNPSWIAARDGKRGHWGARQHMPGQPCCLAIAQSHSATAGFFAGTKWAGGGFAQALGRAPRAYRGVKAKFGRQSLTAVLVPIELVIDESDVPMFTPAPGPGGMRDDGLAEW